MSLMMPDATVHREGPLVYCWREANDTRSNLCRFFLSLFVRIVAPSVLPQRLPLTASAATICEVSSSPFTSPKNATAPLPTSAIATLHMPLSSGWPAIVGTRLRERAALGSIQSLRGRHR